DRAPVRFAGRRLFVAAGGYSTPRLVLESRDQYASEVIMLESQYFLIPILQWRSFPHAATERLTTLSQVCFRLRDPSFGARDVHLLLYTYNPLYPVVLKRTPARFVPGLPRALVARLSSLQGYLHSDVSPRFALSLRRNSAGPATLVVEGRVNPESARVVRRVEARVRSLSRFLRATPVPFMTKLGAPGKSYHSGGTFPMKRDPGPDDTDLLGRPAGHARVHLVDASVFPAIPATNMTLTLMANAYRIAAASVSLGREGP
ncbi:MAG: GMC oxidoreductase, partial [Candidatus Eisenbacteria bacterium]